MHSLRKDLGRAQSEILIVVVIMGLLAIYFMHHLAVTSQAKQHVAAALTAAKSVEQAVMDYRDDHKAWPDSIYDLHLEPHVTDHGTAFTTDFSDAQLVITFDQGQDRLAGKTLILKPSASMMVHGWSCTGGTVETDYLPKACLPYSL